MAQPSLLLLLLLSQNFDARFEEIRKAATPSELYSFFWDMPKGGDIHHHLALSFRPEEWYEAAGHYLTRAKLSHCPDEEGTPLKFHMSLPARVAQLPACVQGDYAPVSKLDAEQKAAWVSALVIDKAYEGRNEFFEAIVGRLSEVSQDPDVVLAMLPRLLDRYAREGLLYVETQYMPASQEARERLRRLLAEKKSPVTMRFQAVVVRFRADAEQRIEQWYEAVNGNRDLWVGINLAGREDNTKGHALRFLETFRKMRRQYSGIHLSIHGGEVDAPGHEVRNTLLLGAERIGHGFNLITDPEAMLWMRNGRHLVEVSLVSNRLLEYSPDLAAHPFIEYLRFGIPVCLNTDDSGVWDSNLTDEYFLASKHYKLTWTEIVQLGRNSLAHSFAQPEVKKELLARFEAAVKAFEAKYGSGDWRAALRGVRPEVSRHAARAILR